MQCTMATDEVTANNGVVRQEFTFSGIPDHNAWGMTPGGMIAAGDYSFRLPKCTVVRFFKRS